MPVIQHLSNWKTLNQNFRLAGVREGEEGSSHMATATATYHLVLQLLCVWPLPPAALEEAATTPTSPPLHIQPETTSLR